MESKLCFKLNDEELLLDQVLVDFNGMPIYFICKTVDGQYYIALSTNIDPDKYIVAKTNIKDIIGLFEQTVPMCDLILKNDNYWNVVASDNINDDICTLSNIETIDKSVLPCKDAYYKIISEDCKIYFKKIMEER